MAGGKSVAESVAVEIQPYLQLFRTSPLVSKNQAALASALQAFETSVLLIGMGRFPAALIICAGAIESTIKSIPGTTINIGSDGLKAATEYVLQRKRRLGHSDLRRFIERRNEFIHRGYSPAHDGEAAELLINAGFNFLSGCLYEFHNISLRESLIEAVWHHILVAQKVIDEIRPSLKADPAPNLNWQVRATKALQHMVRHGFLPTQGVRWTEDSAVSQDHEFAARRSIRQEIENFWEPFVEVHCPIPTCGSSECLVKLEEVPGNPIAPRKLFCFECLFQLNEADSALLTHLVGIEIAQKKTQIFSDYGIK